MIGGYKVELLGQAIVGGLLLGGVYAIIAIGLNLIYGVMEVINFAHAEFLMISMYVSFWLFTWYNVDPFISLIVILPLTFSLGLATERLLIERILKGPLLMQTCATFGLLLVLQNVALFLWKEDYRSIPVSYGTQAISLGGVLFSVPRLLAFVAAMLSILALYVFLMRTATGLALRATSQNRMGATVMGINALWMYRLAFGLACMLAGAAGVFVSTFYYIYPTVGSVFILRAFIIVVVGGMGNIFGAAVGGLLIGMAESLGAFLIAPAWKEAVALALFIVVLLFKPTGIFGIGMRR